MTTLGGHAQGISASYLRDYLEASFPLWRMVMPSKFSWADSKQWLRSNTHADGAYGLDYITKGVDELVKGGYIIQDGDSLTLTQKFVTIMREHL
jgi:hypothetical protein